ncbi:MAG: SDR family oxidoreductase [Phycisphaerales bacterium]|nr:SDR family oxidoreductase [Phycisphaerales bacterium]
MQRLRGKVALVTGAARGIGAACARALASEGASVWVTDILDDLAAAVAREIGPSARHAHLDVRDETQWSSVIDRITSASGGLDVLLNNAGVTGFDPPDGPQDPEHASLDSWRQVHAVNSDGTFLGCKHAIRVMKPPTGRGGSIINVSSRSGLVGIAGAAAYASSKAAIRNHTKSVALYCAQQHYGIRCNSIHPGAILTPMWDAMLGDGPERAEAIAEIAEGVPLGRMGKPEDVAHLVVYLASDESGYMTGSELTLDGGILAGWEAQPQGRS